MYIAWLFCFRVEPTATGAKATEWPRAMEIVIGSIGPDLSPLCSRGRRVGWLRCSCVAKRKPLRTALMRPASGGPALAAKPTESLGLQPIRNTCNQTGCFSHPAPYGTQDHNRIKQEHTHREKKSLLSKNTDQGQFRETSRVRNVILLLRAITDVSRANV